MAIKAQFSITLSRVDDGQTGKQGAAGVGVKSSVVTYQGSSSGTSAPTGTWLTSIPAVAAGSYLWTRTVTTMTDGSSSTAYSVALQGKTGGTGPKGNDITSYASGTTLPASVAVANSQFWLLNNSGIVQKVYKSDGSKWIELPISASMINAATFNGFTYIGVNFIGSKFTSTFSNVQPTGFAQTVSGTSTLADGSLVTDVYQNGTSTKISHNEFNQLGVVTQQYVGEKVGMQALLGQGQLDLGGYFSPLAGGDPVWNESTLSARTLYLLNNTGKAIWNGVSLMGSDQAINAKVLLENTLIGWVFQWSQYDTVANKSIDRNWTYCLVPKAHNIGHDPNTGWSVEMPMVIPNKGNFTKIVWVANNAIGGDSSGTTGLQLNSCLRAIYAV